MSNKILNSKSRPYWWDKSWSPAHMTIQWLAGMIPPSSGPLKLPERVWRRKQKAKKVAKMSRKINRGRR